VSYNPAPDAPTDLEAIEGHDGVSLSWHGETDVHAYVVFRNGTEIGRTGVEASHFDDDAKPEVTYTYTVVAIGENGQSEPSASAGGSWSPPAAPSGLTCGQDGERLIFSCSSSDDAAEYDATLGSTQLEVDGTNALDDGH